MRDVIAALADQYALTDQERGQVLPSGKQRTFDNRVHWAKTYLKQAGLVRYTRRGYYVATDEGREVLASKPDRIDNSTLKQFDAFEDFLHRNGSQTDEINEVEEPVENVGATPDEIIRAAHKKINISLAADLLDRVRQSSPLFFEDLIIELLLVMGYGGTSEDAARALGGVRR